MDEKILELLQHALGRNEYGVQEKNDGRDWRNHFVAGRSGGNLDACREAVKRGLMVEHEATAVSGGSPWFYVTEAGNAYIAEHSPKPPKLTRSERRYRKYLDADSSLSFGEWMRLR